MKKLFAQGEFVLNDKNGNPIHVGDTVKITRPAFTIPNRNPFFEEYSYDVEALEVTGQVRIYLSKGIAVIDDFGSKYYPTVTKNALTPYVWELIK
jgi:hypothetical protein